MAITNTQLSRQASFIAKNAADYAADILWCDDRATSVAKEQTVMRFLAVIRERADIIERMHKTEGQADDL